jgi:hypothetical protein
VVIDAKVRVLDVIVVNKAAGGASDTITVKNGANAITNAIDTNKADATVTRAGTLDDARTRSRPGRCAYRRPTARTIRSREVYAGDAGGVRCISANSSSAC